jgi:hypothetical protein
MATDTEAGRAQPQTTIEPPGGPFIRYSQQGRRPMYQVTSQGFGNTITQPLVSVPGYFRAFRFRAASTGGINALTATVTYQADAPFNAFSLVQLRDAFGTPLFTGDGFSILFLVAMFSGGYGLGYTANPANMPSWTSAGTSGQSQTATAVTSWTFATALPLEFARGYGVISGANASLLPTLLLQTQLPYTGTLSTNPVLEVDFDSDFYWLPEGIQIAPPGLGSTRQWVVQQANPTIATSSTTTAVLPRLGGFIDTLILVLRDSSATNARQDGWPSRLRLYLDGVPVVDTRLDELYDDIMNQFQLESTTGTIATGSGRPTGVVAFTRKASLSQISLGLLDTYETAISTNPGTLVQVEGSPWGSGGTSPYTLTAIAGQVVPSGTLIQGLPEV